MKTAQRIGILLVLLLPGLMMGFWMQSVNHDVQKLKLENERRTEEIERLRHGDHPDTRFGNILGCIIDPKISESYRYNTCIEAAAHKFEVDPYLIWHLVQAESKFNRLAESNGMIGLLQLKPGYCPRLTHLRDAASNLHCGVKRLKQYQDQFGEDTEQVLWAWWVGTEMARHMKVNQELHPNEVKNNFSKRKVVFLKKKSPYLSHEVKGGVNYLLSKEYIGKCSCLSRSKKIKAVFCPSSFRRPSDSLSP